MQGPSVQEQYDLLACQYNLLHRTDARTESAFLEEQRDLLSRFGEHPRILDCACGTGNKVIALAKKGFDITASDISSGMLARLEARLADLGISVPVIQSSWEGLPEKISSRFDVVYCLGNAICHCRSLEEMRGSLAGMHGVMAEKGCLLVGSEDWEQLLQKKPRIWVQEARNLGDSKVIPLYIWTLRGLYEESHLEVVFVSVEGTKTSYRKYDLLVYPFRRDDLVNQLRQVGFTNIDVEYSDDGLRYCVRAQKR